MKLKFKGFEIEFEDSLEVEIVGNKITIKSKTPFTFAPYQIYYYPQYIYPTYTPTYSTPYYTITSFSGTQTITN